jgi:hypothetical protein
MYSSHGLISTNECGVQTEATCLQAYKMLDCELTQRNIPRPVVMLTDNHASRKGESVLDFCVGPFERHGFDGDITAPCTCRIRQHFEPGASSGFLQALDQYNKKFHEAYTKERKRFQEQQRLEGRSETLNTSNFLSIVCDIWPFWSNPSDRRSAFKKVGILQHRLASDLVDRSKFTAVMKPPPPVSPSGLIL